jgi:hypothetical protein
MITCEEIAVGADQDFEAFVREWAEEYIWPVEDFLDDRDQAYLAEKRSIENATASMARPKAPASLVFMAVTPLLHEREAAVAKRIIRNSPSPLISIVSKAG